jgi:NAD(P)-dependent dehydrogenase (short-subunit alcohol dehydrogenase family)
LYIITGAGSGIGKETYNLLKKNKKNVIGVDLINSDLNFDLADFNEIKKCVKYIAKNTNEIEGIVTCAGVSSGDKILDTNYFGSINFIKELKRVKKIDNVVLIGSVLSKSSIIDEILYRLILNNSSIEINKYIKEKNINNLVAYATTKKALNYFCLSEAKNNTYNINIIHPGLVDTNMTKEIINSNMFKSLFYSEYDKVIPSPINPKEVADLIFTIVSSKSITGQSIFIDKGVSL